MHAAEQSHVLCIDPGSNLAGVTLWYCGELIAHTVLKAPSSTATMSKRLSAQVPQLSDFLNRHLPIDQDIHKILFEGVRARLVTITVGAFLTAERLDCKMHPKASFVESISWKNWARKNGASGEFKRIKGVKALREVGFDVDKHGIVSDDVADAVLIYLTWREKL